MSKIRSALSTGLILLAAVITGATYASHAIESLNAEVEIKAQQMSLDSGVALTDQQKNDLKIAMILGKVANVDDAKAAINLQEKAAMVVATYQLADPRDQHKLLITLNESDSKI